MASTPRLDIPYILASQSQKAVTHNAALNRLDMLVQTIVKDRDLSAPPGSPAEGEVWIVASAATGDWAGQENSLAQYIGGGWFFMSPAPGFRAYVEDEALSVIFHGSGWSAVLQISALQIGGDQVVGTRAAAIADASGGATVDTEARVALNALLSAIRSHGLIES